ncbi:MAG: hypothetical protein INR73_17365 [Williamsia sp.]|nr:hypothetical protein [Williamsia sp.]
MKPSKSNIDDATWRQLTEKMKEADQDKRRKDAELREKVNSVLGNRNLKITVPKNFDSRALLKAKSY